MFSDGIRVMTADDALTTTTTDNVSFEYRCHIGYDYI